MATTVQRLGILFALLGASFGQSPTRTPEVWVLAIGIDAYRGEPLPNCVNDAKDIVGAVTERGIDGEHVCVVLDRSATRQAILEELRAFAARLGADGEGLVYYSGHGTRVPDQNGDEGDGFDEAWLAVDLQPVLDDEIEAILGGLGARVLVIADSCHSGTVTKSLELGGPENGLQVDVERNGSLERARIDGRKYVGPARVAQILAAKEGETIPPFEEPTPTVTPRDIGVVAATARDNANGGRASRHQTVETGGAWLLAACSDQEYANATAGRNSAFTAELLGVLRLEGTMRDFAWLRDTIDARLRNRALRYTQHPALAGVRPEQALPSYLQSAELRRAAGAPRPPDAAQAQRIRENARVDARQTLSRIVEGIFRREDAGRQGLKPWIADFRTGDGSTEVRNGDRLVLRLRVASDAPSRLYPVVVNVGPTGNLALLYPNFEDRSAPLAPGQTLTIGERPSKVNLPVEGSPGQESLVAYLLEWDAFAGVDWSVVTSKDQKLLTLGGDECLSAGPRSAESRNGMVRPRDISVVAAPGRPGESFSRMAMSLEHR